MSAALPAFAAKIEADEFVIVESNSLRRFMNPVLYLQVLDVSNPDFKLSAKEFFDLSDAYVLVKMSVDRPGILANSVLLEREIQRNKPHFTVTKEDRFISNEIVEFVRSRLAPGESDVARCL